MMTMKKIFLLLTLCCVAIGCKKVTVDFSFSPTDPRAGQKVTFSNLSSSGESWEWSFGDGATSTLKTPSHTYKKPGTYRVQLKVDKKNSLIKSADITVVDTIPSFSCADTTFVIYHDYTFTAQVYNPYSYTVEYAWDIESADAAVQPVNPEDGWNGSSLSVRFLQPTDELTITLTVTLNGETTLCGEMIRVEDRPAHSILLRTAQGDYRQRIFGKYAEEAFLDEDATLLLEEEQDTFQVYNGYAFYLSDMKAVFPELEGFHIANRKFYYRTDEGLWIANIDGSNQVEIDDKPCTAMTLDTEDNRIYWANAEGVWYMPFIGSDNNKFITTPTLLNEMGDVTKLAADYEPK